ncbi:hypothetical protein [Mesorhizobium sp.]|uniref:hypothetical protein n=1 Tax=Mesorhizobium sp. TaxID=1871066 RepID=UPI003BA966BF
MPAKSIFRFAETQKRPARRTGAGLKIFPNNGLRQLLCLPLAGVAARLVDADTAP